MSGELKSRLEAALAKEFEAVSGLGLQVVALAKEFEGISSGIPRLGALLLPL